MKRALVIGGGIAGTVTAIALKKAGLDPVLYEAYDRTADGVGAYLTLAVNGLDTLGELGLRDVVRAKGFDTPRMAMLLGNGKKVAEFPLGGPTTEGTVSQTIIRSDLYLTLRDEAVRQGVTVEYNKRLTNAENHGDGVRATFADGTNADGDLLIGADGLRSQVRRIIDPMAPAARYLPMLNTGGFAEGIRVDSEPGVMNMVFGKRAFFCYFQHPSGQVGWFANPPRKIEPASAELAAITPEEFRAELVELFEADRTPAVDIIKATPKIYPPWVTYDFPTVPNWRTDRMIIVGDAAHAVSPASGQGASMAIEDAVTLGRCLRDIPDLPQALAAYESLRRERVEAVVRQGKRNGSAKVVGPVGRVVRDFFITLIFSRMAGKKDPNEWAWNYRIHWDERVKA
jgi:2-polyprenyl-6-methoxyphenol hydroxylase-like FAD-dependent oxidoreductase